MIETDFDNFVNRHYQVVLMRAREVIGSQGDMHDAEDVTQEVFIQYWGQQSRLDPTRDHTGILLQSVRQRAIAFLKRRHPTAALEQDPVAVDLPSLENFEDFQTAKDAFWALPEADRKLIFLRYFQKYTLEKCARLAGMRSRFAVNERINRILKSMRADAEHRVARPHF